MLCLVVSDAALHARRSSPGWGFPSLLFLGLGIIVTLFAYGTGIGTVGPRLRTPHQRVLDVVVLLLGYHPLEWDLRSVGIPAPKLPVPFYQPLRG